MKRLGHHAGWLAVAGLLFTGSACAYGTRAAADAPTAPAAISVKVVVTNVSGSPMEVYAVGSGTSWRLGPVLPGLATTFVVPQGMVRNGAVELVAQPFDGGSRILSGRLLLVPGNVVDFNLTAQPMLSTAIVR